MSDYTLEQKLAILEKMKREQARNEIFVQRKRNYGAASRKDSTYNSTYDGDFTELSQMSHPFAKLRFLLALFLLAGYFILHFTGFSYKTFYAESVEVTVSSMVSAENIKEELKEFVENIEKIPDLL